MRKTFSLRSLLIVIAVIAVVTWYYVDAILPYRDCANIVRSFPTQKGEFIVEQRDVPFLAELLYGSECRDTIVTARFNEMRKSFPYIESLDLIVMTGDISPPHYGMYHSPPTVSRIEIEKLVRLGELRELDLSCVVLASDALRDLPQSRNLRELHLSLTPVGAENLASIQRCENLTTLAMTDFDIGAFTRGRFAAKLKRLEISDPKLDASAVDAIVAQNRLVSLDVACSGIDDTAIKSICAGLPRLETLSLSYTKATKSILPSLYASHTIKTLEVYETLIKPEALAEFPPPSGINVVSQAGREYFVADYLRKKRFQEFHEKPAETQSNK